MGIFKTLFGTGKANKKYTITQKEKFNEEIINLILQGDRQGAFNKLLTEYNDRLIAAQKLSELNRIAVERTESKQGPYQELMWEADEQGNVKSAAKSGVKDPRWYPEGFWTPGKGRFPISLGKFFFVMFVIAASLVLPFIFKESGSAWFLSFAATTWAVATIFPSSFKEGEEKTGLLIFKASLNGMAVIFLSLGLIAISPSTPFMRLLTLVVFTIAYLSFPTSGGSESYAAILATWRMLLGFYFVFFFIFAFMNVLSVSPMIFISLLLLALAFYFNMPNIESWKDKMSNLKMPIINVKLSPQTTGGMLMWGVMMMIFGATMALFLGGMKIFGFSSYWLASITYFAGIFMLVVGPASEASGEAVVFSTLASIGLALGAFDLWIEKHYFAAMGYNMLVGMSIATGAASQQARPIIGVTALSFAIIILSSAYPAVLGEAVFGVWWPSVEGGVTTLVGPIASTTEQMQESFQNAFLMFSCPSCYYEKQLQQQQANADVKSGGTVKGIEVSDFTFQVVNIPEQPLLATATLENKGEFTASNIQAKLKSLQTKSKKGTYTTQENVAREFVTCSGTTLSGTKDTCVWKDASYSGDMKLITFKYGAGSSGWAALGSCSCYTSDGKQKGYCLPVTKDASGKDLSTSDPNYDKTGCRKCASLDQKWADIPSEGLTNKCDLSKKDTISYDYGGSFVAVGFDYSFDYIVNVSLDLQLIQPQTLNDLLLKKQITLRETSADYSGGPVQASIWTQKQPVRAGEDTLAVISLKNSGTGTVKVSAQPSKCEDISGGECMYTGSETLGTTDCAAASKKVPLPELSKTCGLLKVCCVPSTYTSISGTPSNYILTIPFISGIKPSITEISKGGLDCGSDVKYDAKTGSKGKDVIENTDSFELHCALTTDLGKAAIARYAFLFNYDIPKDIDRKSVIFVGNANYQYQNSKTMETQIIWAPPQ